VTGMVIADRPSPNHDARARAVDLLVIHYTGMEPAERALAWLCDPQSKVSAHYLIDQQGAVTRMVAEDRRAWHAGVAWWRVGPNESDDVNSRSIGIELANPGHEFGYEDFPEPQLAALIELATGILGRHAIAPRNVVAHSDVAPGRKIDPGERFPWPRLADAGIGFWPDDWTSPGAMGANIDLADTLAAIGYPVAQAGLAACTDAFCRHWHPQAIGPDGEPITGEETLADTRNRAAALLAQLAADPALS